MPGLWPHTARRSIHLLQEFGLEVFNHHLSYRPDFAPIFSYSSRNSCLVSVSVFRIRDAEMSVSVVPIAGGRVLRYGKPLGNMNKSEYIIKYSLFVAYTQICKNKTVEYLLIC